MIASEPRSSAPPVFWALVEESLDEAEFLWRRWESALIATDQRLSDVSTWIEDRLLGSIDGLVVAGDAGIDRVLAPALEADDPHRVAAAFHAVIRTAAPVGAQLFASQFEGASAEKRWALRRGLELAARDDGVEAFLGQLATRASEPARAAAIDAASFGGRFLRIDFRACFSGGPVLQRAAATHLRHAPAALQVEWIDYALNRLSPTAQPAAVETALLAGHPAGLDACRELAAAQIAPSNDMLILLAMLGSDADQGLVMDLLAKPNRRRHAVWSLGFAGRKDSAAACIDLLAQGLEVKVAAEAFAAITGLDLAAEGMIAPEAPEPDEPVAFEDDDLDADLGPRPEDRLPQPEIPALIRWWSQNQTRFDRETRYIGGQPITFELLQRSLEHGPMRRRGPIASELAVRTENRYSVQTLDFTHTQKRQMGVFHTLPRDVFAKPMARVLTRSERRR